MSKQIAVCQTLAADISDYLEIIGEVEAEKAKTLGESLAALLRTAAAIAVDRRMPDDTAITNPMGGCEACVYMSMRDLIQHTKWEIN